MRNLRILGGWRECLGVAALLATAAAVAAQQPQRPSDAPQFQNAKLEQRALAGPLAADLNAWIAASGSARWLGYAVPAQKHDQHICCGEGANWNHRKCGPCALEGTRGGDYSNDAVSRDTAKLEGNEFAVILLRAENKRLGKIRVFSEDCALDAGGLSITWLSMVNPAESVAYLEKRIDASEMDEHGGDERVSRGALTAIAMHGDPSADQALARLTAPDKPEGLRKEAAFWTGEARGAAGLAILKRMAKEDPSSEVRAHVAFALSLNHEPDALNEMIRMAHDDSSAHVRSQALFWLAQKAGTKASSTITAAIENDPDTEVKKKAVFALSQMPKDQGVPKLIEVAQNNRNPEVRKQAMFWLGQSNDPRALEFFEKILAK